MSIDDKHSDNDLKAYLDGRDGVSAAYRETAQQEPPRALDEIILKAARKQAQPSTELWYAKRRPYALAASFMIAVVAVSLYFSSLDEIVVPEAIERATVRAVELQRADAPEADEKVADAAASPEATAGNVALAPAFETRQLAPAVPTVGADPVAPPAAPTVDLNREAFARVAEPAAVVIDGPLLEAIEAEAAGAQAPQVASTGGALEEITVTGSRIMRRDEGDVSYRNSREDWLDEIRFMTDEFESRSRLITARAAAARIEEQLNEEIELYLEAYPEADIEAELEALEE
jgi:hypothetical protein